MVSEHKAAPHARALQRRLAEEVTLLVHGKGNLENAQKASAILFGKSTAEDLRQLDDQTFLDVFDGVPQAELTLEQLTTGLDMIAALAAQTGFLSSNGEARRELKQNSISVNKDKVNEEYRLTEKDLINGRFIVLQKGKRNYFVLSFR